MNTKLRIWRVVPTSETGAKAPYFFVETEKFFVFEAEVEAIKKAEKLCMLSKFKNWHMSVTKTKMRKDGFGKYWTYHQ